MLKIGKRETQARETGKKNRKGRSDSEVYLDPSYMLIFDQRVKLHRNYTRVLEIMFTVPLGCPGPERIHELLKVTQPRLMVQPEVI